MTAAEAFEDMKQEAFDKIALYTDADCAPVITDYLPELLWQCQRAAIWEAGATYGVGDVVQLYPSNGRRYRCITAGTSAATSAAFPISVPSYYGGYSFSDGTAGWEECGPAYANVFYWRAGIHAGCQLKAAKASALIDQSGISASQVQAQWRQRASDFAPLGVA